MLTRAAPVFAFPFVLQAMFVDFGMAVQYGGVCYLRYDDTNPEAEKQVRCGGGSGF
jgi:hypothetical protein